MTTDTLERRGKQTDNLMDHSQSELDELFQVLPAIREGELSGNYKGSLFAITGLGWLPRQIRIWLYQLLGTFVNPWKGKNFSQETGANIWLNKKGKLQFSHYSIEHQRLGQDDSPLTYLSYQVDNNPNLLQPVRGEIRKLNYQTYLARMNYKTKKRTVRVLYFTLTKLSD